MEDKAIAFVARVWPDWTALQLPNGDVFGFCRETGKVYKLPHPDCPIIQVGCLLPEAT